jgi:cytochrome c oxidase cbb3-type subunit 2
MERSGIIFLGVIATVIISYLGLVEVPKWQASGLQPIRVESGMYPPRMSEAEKHGKRVYTDLGCVYCHSQQVRQNDFGGDISRGWGLRASKPIDYVREKTPLMGTMRTGPDLRNIGARQPSRQWHYLHLYNPQITSPGSTMPPFRFLFETISKDKYPGVPKDKIGLPDDYAVDNHWVVPTKRAKDLVTYLKSLDYDKKLPAEAHRGPKKGNEEEK